MSITALGHEQGRGRGGPPAWSAPVIGWPQRQRRAWCSWTTGSIRLRALGHHVVAGEKTPCSFNSVQPNGIAVGADGELHGGADPSAASSRSFRYVTTWAQSRGFVKMT